MRAGPDWPSAWLLRFSSAGSGDSGVAAAQHLDNNSVTLALIGLIGTMIAALIYLAKMYANTKVSAEQATQANQAVNNVGPGQASIAENVRHINEQVNKLLAIQDEFSKHGWQNLPADIGDAVGLTTTIRDLQAQGGDINAKLTTMIEELRSHVEWEESQKYMDGGTG